MPRGAPTAETRRAEQRVLVDGSFLGRLNRSLSSGSQDSHTRLHRDATSTRAPSQAGHCSVARVCPSARTARRDPRGRRWQEGAGPCAGESGWCLSRGPEQRRHRLASSPSASNTCRQGHRLVHVSPGTHPPQNSQRPLSDPPSRPSGTSGRCGHHDHDLTKVFRTSHIQPARPPLSLAPSSPAQIQPRRPPTPCLAWLASATQALNSQTVFSGLHLGVYEPQKKTTALAHWQGRFRALSIAGPLMLPAELHPLPWPRFPSPPQQPDLSAHLGPPCRPSLHSRPATVALPSVSESRRLLLPLD